MQGEPIYADPEDMNNNIESHDDTNITNPFAVQRNISLYTLFNTHMPAVEGSDSDWSDLA